MITSQVQGRSPERGRVRVGILGCADIAARRAIPAAERTAGIEIAAVAGRDFGRTRRFAAQYEIEAVDGYEALLQRPDIDAVYIPLPAALHAPWAARSLATGHHTLVEKPATPSAEEARGLVRDARSRSLVLMENFAYLRHTQWRLLRRLIAAGAIGRIHSVEADFAFPLPPDGDIRLNPELGGGAFLDAGVYPIRSALDLLGSELEVAGAVLTFDEAGLNIGGTAALAHRDGAVARLGFGFDHSYRCSCTVWGSGGSLTLTRAYSAPDDHRPLLQWNRGSAQQTLHHHYASADAQFDRLWSDFAAAIDQRNTSVSSPVLHQAGLIDEVFRRALRREVRL